MKKCNGTWSLAPAAEAEQAEEERLGLAHGVSRELNAEHDIPAAISGRRLEIGSNDQLDRSFFHGAPAPTDPR